MPCYDLAGLVGLLTPLVNHIFTKIISFRMFIFSFYIASYSRVIFYCKIYAVLNKKYSIYVFKP